MKNPEVFLKRYKTSIQTPGFGVPGQEAIAKAKVLVTGGAAFASTVLASLAAMGTGLIGIASQGRITLEDQPAQPLLFSSAEGKIKVQAIAKQLREVNAEVKIHLYEEALTAFTAEKVIPLYDVVIDCSDNLSSSLLINDACVMIGKPMVYAAISQPLAFITVANFKKGGTLRCMLSEEAVKRVYPGGGFSGLPALATIAASLAVNEVVKVIGEIGSVSSNKLLVFNSFDSHLQSISFSPVPENCSISSVANLQQEPAGTSETTYPREISAQLLQTKIRYKETLQLVDIREDQQRKDNIWNVLHIPQSELLNRSDEIHQDIMVVLISEDGRTAETLCALLNEKHGFDNIYYLKGGFNEWMKETSSSAINYESF